MRYVLLIWHAMSGVTKLGSVYVQSIFVKKAAVKQFQQELQGLGLPQDVTAHLTADYADMVNINPFAYAKLFTKKA
jgi:hypothetical protein